MPYYVRAIILLLLLSLMGCGFHLRGYGEQINNFKFQNVYLKASHESAFVEDLRNALVFNKVAVSSTPEKAAITLEIVSENSDKQILAMSGAGRIREYQLRYRISLRAYDNQMTIWLPEEEILLVRDMLFDDSQILAKEQEEALLYKDMRTDAVQQAMRRLSRAKPYRVRIP